MTLHAKYNKYRWYSIGGREVTKHSTTQHRIGKSNENKT